MEYAHFLRNHLQEIVTLSDEEFITVLSAFTFKTIQKKAHLLTMGKTVTEEFFVTKGCLKAYTEDEQLKEHILQFAMEGWWISDYTAYAKSTKGILSVQALENCEVLAISCINKQNMLQAVPKMHEFFGRKSFGGYVALQNRVLSLLKNSAKEKYDLLLQQYPQLFQRVSKTLIAQYLGVSRETLSRLEKK